MKFTESENFIAWLLMCSHKKAQERQATKRHKEHKNEIADFELFVLLCGVTLHAR